MPTIELNILVFEGDRPIRSHLIYPCEKQLDWVTAASILAELQRLLNELDKSPAKSGA